MEIPVYPKIPLYSRDVPSKPCIAFEKYDGTNLSYHWNRLNGFQDFYTRRRKLIHGEADFGAAIPLFQEQEKALTEAFVNYPQATDIVVYAEYFGPKSFAGFHQSGDQMRIVILDIWVSDCGFIEPKELLHNFKALPLAKVIYRGKITGKFVDAVKKGAYPVDEGVVCKGGVNGKVWTCKIKTSSWMQKLETSFKDKSWTAPDGIHRNLEEEQS